VSVHVGVRAHEKVVDYGIALLHYGALLGSILLHFPPLAAFVKESLKRFPIFALE